MQLQSPETMPDSLTEAEIDLNSSSSQEAFNQAYNDNTPIPIDYINQAATDNQVNKTDSLPSIEINSQDINSLTPESLSAAEGAVGRINENGFTDGQIELFQKCTSDQISAFIRYYEGRLKDVLDYQQNLLNSAGDEFNYDNLDIERQVVERKIATLESLDGSA